MKWLLVAFSIVQDAIVGLMLLPFVILAVFVGLASYIHEHIWFRKIRR